MQTAHDREDMDRVSDFLKGLQDSQREETLRAVTHTAAIIGGVAAYQAYKRFKKQGRG